ncbi:MAG: hypothetical protein EBR82_50900 [Caulobacteraceae bacterium]|nr:hypothetical protein [Caulobacteraceae bacterium]
MQNFLRNAATKPAEMALRGVTPAVELPPQNTQDQERRDMSADNTQDGAEPSPASAGSVSVERDDDGRN